MKIRTDGAVLHVEVRGRGDPILFVHGFPLSGEMWHGVAERLAGRWMCVMPNLRGHGESEATEEMTIGRYADDLAAVQQEVCGGRPAVVVGLSMGGIITFDFFRRHRERVRALGLVCTRANAESAEGIARREAMAQAALREGSRAVAYMMIGNAFGPKVDPKVREYWHGIMCRTSPVGVAAAARAMGSRPDSFETLARIDCPTLVVAGEDDSLTPAEGLRAIHEGIRGSEYHVISESGHVPPVEKPEAFVRVLEGFLESLPRLA